MMKHFLISATLLIGVAAFAQIQRALQPSDIYRLKDISSPQISPDGKWIAYSLSTVDSSKDKRSSDVWMISYDGKENVQLTNNPANESTPKWSPDGKYLAFLSPRKNGDDKEEDGSQVWLLDRRGGEGKKITNIKGEIEEYKWSPDGQKMLLAIKEKDLADTAKTKIRKPYVIDRYQFKQDYQGYLDRRATHLYLFDITTKKLDTLTEGIYSEKDAEFSPDGSLIAFVSNRTEDPDKNDNADIYVMAARPRAAIKKLTIWTGNDTSPRWSPDGKWIAYSQSSSNENFTMFGQPILAVISKEGGQPRLITGSADRPVRNFRWTADGKSLVMLMDDDRQVNVVAFDVATAKRRDILVGNRSFNFIESTPTANNWIALMTEPYKPTELYAVENGTLRQITHLNDSFIAPIKLATVEPFQSKSKDGTMVSGILYRPPFAARNQKLPLILYIHGGPVSQDSYRFDMDRHMYAAAGYAVAAVNYRGSNGRGLEFIRSIYGDWGNKEVEDIIGAADHLIAQGIADENRLGIAGWSYGGISTNYVIATTPRFKAAVSGAGSSLQLTLYGSDQYVSQYEQELGPPWKNPEKWIAVSYPFFKADRIKTPTLFMASQNDFNVPVAGAEQMYQALRSLGVPTQLVIYPGQFHGLSVPSYIKDRWERHIEWFNKYIK
ncbi:MAG TPA: S9 family peptidase [Flavisolibacter sp.]|nr:S9 family peptidase [Flavisolibacter sp.]